MKKYLTVSEISRMSRISADTLRYYDKTGIFKPDYVDEKTGYRYYSYVQCEQISTIVELKNLGIPLKDISEYMQKRSVDSSIALLESLKKTVAAKISELEKIENSISNKLSIISDVRDNYADGRIEKKHIGRRKIITMGEYIEKLEDGIYAQIKLESLYSHEPSVYATSNVGTLVSSESLYDDERQKLRRTPMMFIDDEQEHILSPEAKQYIAYIDEGEFLCITGHGRFRYASDTAMAIKQYLFENDYITKGNLIERELIDLSVTDNTDEIVYMIEVPVFPNEKFLM